MTRILLSCEQDMHRLAAYQLLEPWIRDARVLEVGSGAGHGLRQIFALGARSVLGLDRDILGAQARVAALEEVVALRPYQPPRLGLRGERFDVAIVSDVTVLVEHVQVLTELKGALGPDGLLVVRAESRDRPGAVGGLSYGELLDLLGPAFGVVRVFGQSPMVGYSLAELTEQGDGDLDLFVDGSLMGGAVEEVTSYLVLCGASAARHLEGAYGILQVPSEGDAALERWWDSLGGEAQEDEEPCAPTPVPGDVAQTALPAQGTPVARVAEPAPGDPSAAPSVAPRPSRGAADLLGYMDGRGGRVPRWKWPTTG